MRLIKKQLKGYTLIELLLALGIISILAVTIFMIYEKVTTERAVNTIINESYSLMQQNIALIDQNPSIRDPKNPFDFPHDSNFYYAHLGSTLPNASIKTSPTDEATVGNSFQAPLDYKISVSAIQMGSLRFPTMNISTSSKSGIRPDICIGMLSKMKNLGIDQFTIGSTFVYPSDGSIDTMKQITDICSPDNLKSAYSIGAIEGAAMRF